MNSQNFQTGFTLFYSVFWYLVCEIVKGQKRLKLDPLIQLYVCFDLFFLQNSDEML